jgi:methylmalonyl-CoA/ethylmalonyl-CoA epimerase
MVPVADLDQAISELTDKGYRVIATLNLPIAKVAYCDTFKEIGVATEIIGVTEAGLDFVQQLKSGTAIV